MAAFKIVFVIILLMVVATFAVQNMASVPVRYYDYKFTAHSVEVPLLMIILISSFAGFLIAWAAGLCKQFKLKSLLRQSNRTIRTMSSEMDRMKSR